MVGLHTPEEDRDFFRNHLFSKCEIWGAVDGRLVGFTAFGNEWIEQLYILPEWQGQGIGKALLDIAKGKCSTLRLWTFQQNKPARQFYERNGFVPIEETDRLGNEAKAPDVLMSGQVGALQIWGPTLPFHNGGYVLPRPAAAFRKWHDCYDRLEWRRLRNVSFPQSLAKTGQSADGPDVAIALVMGTPGGLTHVGWEADSQPLIMLFSYK